MGQYKVYGLIEICIAVYSVYSADVKKIICLVLTPKVRFQVRSDI